MTTERVRAIAEDMLRSVERRRETLAPARGMQVPYHGPLASALPSVLKDVEWWARELLAETDSLTPPKDPTR